MRKWISVHRVVVSAFLEYILGVCIMDHTSNSRLTNPFAHTAAHTHHSSLLDYMQSYTSYMRMVDDHMQDKLFFS